MLYFKPKSRYVQHEGRHGVARRSWDRILASRNNANKTASVEEWDGAQKKTQELATSRNTHREGRSGGSACSGTSPTTSNIQQASLPASQCEASTLLAVALSTQDQGNLIVPDHEVDLIPSRRCTT